MELCSLVALGGHDLECCSGGGCFRFRFRGRPGYAHQWN